MDTHNRSEEARHVLVVTLDDLTAEEQAEYDAEAPEDRKVWDRDRLCAVVECAGVTDSCRTWWECETCENHTDLIEDVYEFGDDRPMLHGVEHQVVDGMWCRWSDQCVTDTMDSDADEVAVYALDSAPGRYPVDIEAEEGYVNVLLDPRFRPATQTGDDRG